jgi:hypothetical protein
MTSPAISTGSKPKSRRALLAGVLGGLGAWASSAIGRASPVQANNGDPVQVGGTHSGTSPTSISSTGSPALLTSSSYTPGGTGVRSYTSADMGIGLQGISHGTGGIGVDGSATASSGANYGVMGHSASPSGAGLLGRATGGGFALRTDGRVRADKVSGVATIIAGTTSTTITPGVNVTSGSFVLLTPKANIGSRALWFTTNATDNTFTIRMSSARSSGTKVAWLLLG